MKVLPLFRGFLLSLAITGSRADNPGNLIIVGGALAEQNDAVHAAFIAAADAAGPERSIVIVPAATAYPTESAEKFRAQLVRRGVADSRVRVLPLAVKDDPTTPDLDESSWAGNGADPRLAEEVLNAGGFWFVGGDQSRITRVLIGSDGAALPVLHALRSAHARGAAVGGTSAGAAIMSDPMILGGDSLGALLHGVSSGYSGMDDQESGPLMLGQGLGFFPFGMVDQHFDQKARHARLIVALARSGIARGYGIDEDTGLIVDFATGTGTVAGASGITIFDTESAEFSAPGGTFSARGIRVSVLAAGDRVNLLSGEITPSSLRKSNLGREAFNITSPVVGAALVPYGSFSNLAGPLLIDNRAVDQVQAIAFSGNNAGSGWRLTLRKDRESAGFTGGGGTTVVNALLALEPIEVTVRSRD